MYLIAKIIMPYWSLVFNMLTECDSQDVLYKYILAFSAILSGQYVHFLSYLSFALACRCVGLP